MLLNRKSEIGSRKWPWLCLLALLPGCLLPERSGVEVSYYSIDPRPPIQPVAKPAALSLAVRPLDSASRYEPRILFTDGGPTVGYTEFERWVEPPAEMVTRAIRRGLSGACVTCVVADDRLVRRPDVLVEGRLTRFDQVRGKDAWSATCELELVVLLADRNRALVAQRFAVTKPAKEPTTAAFVEAMTAAVADIVLQAAATVEKALADHDKSPQP